MQLFIALVGGYHLLCRLESDRKIEFDILTSSKRLARTPSGLLTQQTDHAKGFFFHLIFYESAYLPLLSNVLLMQSKSVAT